MVKNILFLFSVCGIILTGCDYLDREPGDVISEDHFWETANSAALEQYCNTFYPSLVVGHGASGSFNMGSMIMEDFQSDNLLQNGGNMTAFGRNQILVTDGKWDWSIIRSCNAFLNNYLRGTQTSLSDKKKYAGEILFFKSLDYFNKVKRFGDVPWLTKAMRTDDPELYKGRDSRTLVMDSVLKCLNLAIEYLPQKTKVYRVSKDAALALKARACLYEGTWRRYRGLEGDIKFLEEAYEAAGELMKSKYGYSLYKGTDPLKSYFDLFIQDNYDTNAEVILSREYDVSQGLGNDVSNTIPMASMGMSRDCFEEYLCANTGLPISLCACHKDKNYEDEMKDRDGRLLQTICYPIKGIYSYYLFSGDQGGVPNIYSTLEEVAGVRSFKATSSTGYCLSKFFKESEYKKGNTKGEIDAPVFRYAEILLIRAEAGAELGKDPELDKTVNLLRERAGFVWKLTDTPAEDPDLVSKYPVIKGTNANLIREIRRERRIELFAEGYRWDDICRWHVGDLLNRPRRGAKLGDTKLYTESEKTTIRSKVGIENGYIMPYKVLLGIEPTFKERNYLFNVPLNEISLNPRLLPNNPGWE